MSNDHSPTPAGARKQAVIVLGMHRSGTSMLSRIISFLGFHQPKDVLIGDSTNPKGLWEPFEVVRLNERMLADMGTTWRQPGPFAVRSLSLQESREEVLNVLCARYMSNAIRILRGSYGRKQRIVMKDPRLCILWPFWDRALRELDFSPYYVLSFRNPLEVAASLRRHYQIELRASLSLWLHHNLEALDLQRSGNLRTIVSYADLVANRDGLLQSLSLALGVELSDFAAGEIRNFISLDEMHHVESPEAVDESASIPTLVKEIYRGLRDWGTLSCEQRLSQLCRWRTAFDDFCMLTGMAIPVDLG